MKCRHEDSIISHRCKLCDVIFQDYRNSKRIFCSNSCRTTYYNLNASDELREKWRQKATNRIVTLATRLKISELQRGKNNSNWKDGGNDKLISKIRRSLPYKLWRLDVLDRDSFICQECGKSYKETQLDVHHINPLYKLFEQYDIKTLQDFLNCEECLDRNNGVTLCKTCHEQTNSYLSKRYHSNETVLLT